MRRKIFTIIFMFLVILLFCSGITYSMFNSGARGVASQNIAKFVFNATKTDEIKLPLVDLNPGENKEYLFAVSNNYKGKTSDVVIKYLLTVRTMHFIPLDIKIYKLDGSNEELVLTCDENHTRNLDKELVCNADKEEEMSYMNVVEDQYKLDVSFPSEYNGEEFANLVDYIDFDFK